MERPTCGTCPHRLTTRNAWDRMAQSYTGAPVFECHGVPATHCRDEDGTPFEGRQTANEDTPGCMLHPRMGAYVASLT